MRRSLILLPLLLAVAACQSPRANYVASEKTFKELVAFAADEREAGRIDDATYAKLNVAINSGNSALKRWLDTLLATPPGEKPNVSPVITGAVLDALDILEAYFLQKRGD